MAHPDLTHSALGEGQLQRVRGRRHTLYHATLQLEAAVGSPTADLALWQERVLHAARDLQAQIDAHVFESEQPGEFLHSIAEKAPHLVNASAQLAGEHEGLQRRAKDLVDGVRHLGLGDAPDGRSPAEPLRDLALQLMGELVRHRQRGADLMYLAYNEDLGSSGG